ncbi:hypothetical protein SAMN05216371_7079 [Streptomyces sp. TLI_053]|nr:hypothetical protein SAMN05216371_7079 [Streptomyces sp. TLI_053]
MAYGGQRLVRERAAATGSDHAREHVLAVDPQLQPGSPPSPLWQHSDLKPVEHLIALRERRLPHGSSDAEAHHPTDPPRRPP